MIEDLDDFLDPDEFAVVALWKGSGRVIGIFDNEYALLPLGLPGVESNQPQFLCKAADVPGVMHGQSLDVNDTAYIIRGVQPDGTGMVRLIIERT